ncbi:MAG TPA: ThuA domain-containing protein [Planctomycetaceae bacterium]|nr:ThuA domain-containing protein [Planctomycetaceae bacterium]
MNARHLLATIALAVWTFGGALSAAEPVRVLVWDEQQPEQKQAYGDKFLGETIAAYLASQPGLNVKSVRLQDPQQGLDDATLDATDVLIVWSHIRAKDQDDARAEAVVKRVQQGKLALIALHSAHWHKAFVRLMQERTKSDVLKLVPEADRASARFEYVNDQPYYKPVARDARLTPYVERGEGNVWKVTLPACVFPAWRADGAPSHVTTLLPKHPIAAGLPEKWDIAHTEMYGEPFHIPEPDEVVFEEKWDKGEQFRSGCVWRVGEGRVFYFRPGHETFPVYQQPEPLRVLENACRWLK